MAELNKFIQDWMLYTAECQVRLRGLAERILKISCLPQFPNPQGWNQPFVMHLDLAVLLHMRCFGFPTSSLTVLHSTPDSVYSSIESDSRTKYAVGPEEQLRTLLEDLNALPSSENAVRSGA